MVDGGTGRRSKRRDDERADEHQALPPTTGAANASVSERRGCRNACGVPWKGTVPQRVRIPPGNCRSSR